MKSDNARAGMKQAPARSLFNALGFTAEEMKKPMVGIVSSYNEIVPGHMNIDKIVSPQRKDLDEKNRWTVMTMIVDSEGNMKSEFDYTDISEIAIQYEREWEKKYLV